MYIQRLIILKGKMVISNKLRKRFSALCLAAATGFSFFIYKPKIKYFLMTMSLLLISPLSYPEDFVGAQACQSCHQQEYNDWKGSHHDMSMKHANNQTVLADFNDQRLGKNRFYKKEDQYWVNIKGPDGKFNDYQIKYTFGFEPLQQYMVEFNDGRVQLIPFAWDSRPKSQGGNRWFNLYPDMTETHQDFFWTNTGQNWNYMCADCHSTNVSKNYDLQSNSYDTSFSEINVACESCHGPAGKHIAWTKDMATKDVGFSRDLSAPMANLFNKSNQQKTLSPGKIEHSQQVLVCAQCHSRRTQVSQKDHVKNNSFGERYMLDLISSTNYYPDGQVYNENFVYGSFLQSKMYQSGVVCSNCHNPHTAELKLPIENVCLQCHQADQYAVEKHHNHSAESIGAQCVNCHMPETTYMEIDARRDHGFHIPRPDLAKQLGTPDTCLTCHADKNSGWSSHHVNTWFKDSTIKAEKDFSPVFTAINLASNEQELQSVATELSRIAQSINYAPIIRASALTKMASVSNTNTIIAISRAVKNTNENIRLGAIDGSQNMASAEKWRILSPLLDDKVLLVRANAAFALTGLWMSLSNQQQERLSPALNEYIEIQKFNNDRSFSHANLGVIYAYRREYEQAISSINQGIAIEPYFAPSYLNLSQVYRQLGQENDAISALTRGIKANPSNAELVYNLGLAYIRIKDRPRASQLFDKATQLAPENSHYLYIYGLSLEQLEQKRAYGAISNAYTLSNNPQHLYALCDMQLRNQSTEANDCLSKLTQVVPSSVIDQLKNQYQLR
ncbi:MAG: putative CXXCH cytochrome family protein [Oceanicoccus sp.]|jgi:predicted CXXCH cytochrome family protein